MKLVTVLIALFLSLGYCSFGQSMIVNNYSACPYSVFLWAESPSPSGMGINSCDSIQTHFVVPCCGIMPATFPTPYDIEGGPGWDYLPGGATTIGGYMCFGTWSYATCVPGDWIWTKAMVDYTGACTPVCPAVGTIGVCLGAGLPLTITCGSTGSATWTNVGSSVIIDIH